MQARAMSVAALVRYKEDASGNVYFDDSLIPASLDPAHPDLFAVWAERSGLLTRSANWPEGLEIPPTGGDHWKFKWAHLHYRGLRVFRVPVLDREEGKAFQPQSLTIVYACSDDSVGRAGQAGRNLNRAFQSTAAWCNSSTCAVGNPPRTVRRCSNWRRRRPWSRLTTGSCICPRMFNR